MALVAFGLVGFFLVTLAFLGKITWPPAFSILLIAPLEHYDRFELLPLKLATHLTVMLQRGIELLKYTHQPSAFNIGLNLGNIAGGSVKHLHWHLVPRYLGDFNFMEILHTRVLVETLLQTLAKLRQHVDILSLDA